MGRPLVDYAQTIQNAGGFLCFPVGFDGKNLTYSPRFTKMVVTMANIQLDATDRKILSILQSEGRISNLDLAERIGLSPTPCSRRVKRLEDKGVITGYGARVNDAALGHGVSVMISVRLAHQSPSDIDEFLTAIHKLPEITECWLVTGNLDYILKVRASDVDALKDFVLAKLKSISCVSETTTLLILENVKSTL